MLIDLIMTVCLAAHPGDCRKEILHLQSQASFRQCMSHAQPYMAQWSEGHPGLRIVRWQCVIPHDEIEL